MLISRTTNKRWEGPFRFIGFKGGKDVVQMRTGRRIFRATCVRPYVKSSLVIEDCIPAGPDKTSPGSTIVEPNGGGYQSFKRKGNVIRDIEASHS